MSVIAQTAAISSYQRARDNGRGIVEATTKKALAVYERFKNANTTQAKNELNDAALEVVGSISGMNHYTLDIMKGKCCVIRFFWMLLDALGLDCCGIKLMGGAEIREARKLLNLLERKLGKTTADNYTDTHTYRAFNEIRRQPIALQKAIIRGAYNDPDETIKLHFEFRRTGGIPVPNIANCWSILERAKSMQARNGFQYTRISESADGTQVTFAECNEAQTSYDRATKTSKNGEIHKAGEFSPRKSAEGVVQGIVRKDDGTVHLVLGQRVTGFSSAHVPGFPGFCKPVHENIEIPLASFI